MEKLLQRNYLMSDAKLATMATNFAIFAANDLADFTQFGVTADTISALVAKQVAFEGFPPDFDLAGQITEATQAKNAKRGEVQRILDQISARVHLAYKANKERRNRFGFARLRNASDELYLAFAENIADAAQEFLAELAGKGQTQAQIDLLRNMRTELMSLIAAKSAADEARTTITRDRIAMGNELYAKVKEISVAGKAAYAHTNYAKRQQYVIYDSDVPRTPHAAVEVMGYDAQTNKVHWNGTAAATRYEAEIEENGEITTMKTGKGVTELVIPMGASARRVRVRGRNAAGVGKWSAWFAIPPAASPPKKL